MSDQKNKRNYIRRKKYLNDSVTQICSTLRIIRSALHEDTPDAEIQKSALHHAQAIEAACWSPHSRLTEDEYQMIMCAKTRELCLALAKQKIPSFEGIKPTPASPLQIKRSITPQIYPTPSSAPIQNHHFIDETIKPLPEFPLDLRNSFEADNLCNLEAPFYDFDTKTSVADFSDGDIFSTLQEN